MSLQEGLCNPNDPVIEQLIGESPETEELAENWLSEIWQACLASGLYFSGGPAEGENDRRLQLIERIRIVVEPFESLPVRAEADRITAHVLNAAERYQDAISFYARAINGLESAGKQSVAARTRLGYGAALQMTGAYQRALSEYEIADRWFITHSDRSGHARVLVNTGNTFHRLDEHAKALDCHLEAARTFESVGDWRDLAASELNIANCYTFLDQFQRADRMYLRAERLALGHDLESLADQARYNRGYLSFLRGRYSEAIGALTDLGQRFSAAGSRRHAALCDLDLAEIYLQLSLPEEAADLATKAKHAFDGLASRYEAAKATTFLGVAQAQRGRPALALALLEESDQLFAAEKNEFWAGMVELRRAEVLLSIGRAREAYPLALSARQRFETLDIPYQSGTALVLVGRVELAIGKARELRATQASLVALLDTNQIPLLRFSAHQLCGQIHEARGQLDSAREHFVAAVGCLDELRSYLHQDQLRIHFFSDKDSVYQSLVVLDLDRGREHVESALLWCERAKSRALFDLLVRHIPQVRIEADTASIDEMRKLQEKLNSHYIRSVPGGEFDSPSTARTIEAEYALGQALQKISRLDSRFASFFRSGTAQEIQSAVPKDTTVVEFFIANEEVLAFIVTSSSVNVCRRLETARKLRQQRKALDFQMEKFRLGAGYIERHHEQLLATTLGYLEELWTDLVSPWINEIQTERLLVVPHGDLHGIPLHAAYDGHEFLIDRFSINYTPSLNVYRQIRTRGEGAASGAALLIGCADDNAPRIDEEIGMLESMIPGSVVLSGKSASRQAMFERATSARFIHFATHSFFRRDNPMFSGFHLADGPVTALDLYSQCWNAELVSLTGCASGASHVTGGDDLMGLIRGFFHAGAGALLLSLWSVSDDATVSLTRWFYEEWLKCGDKASAIRIAMKKVRAQYEHPFYWAPFVLIGSPESIDVRQGRT